MSADPDLEKKLLSLLTLLDDESPEMQHIVRDAILQHALNIILNRVTYRAALTGDQGQVFSQTMRDLHLPLLQRALGDLLGGKGGLDLEKGMLLLSYWRAPEIPLHRLTSQLDRIAERVAQYFPHQGTPLEKVQHVNLEMFEKGHFSGNSSDYYNPDNSFLHKTLESGLGLPITLSILFLLIAKRLKMPMRGVAMPAHFILKYHDDSEELFFDPFNHGRLYTRESCLEYLAKFKVIEVDEVLNGCESRDILRRVLTNLHVSYSTHTEDTEATAALEQFMSVFDEF